MEASIAGSSRSSEFLGPAFFANRNIVLSLLISIEYTLVISTMSSPETESNPVMNAYHVVDLYTSLGDAGITIWIDGGWAVDALLGKETRVHGDLDIAIEQRHVAQLRQLLTERGYKDIKPEISRAHNFVLANNEGHEIDVHVIVIDKHGNGIYGPAENGEMYPAASLTGTGAINNRAVKCISAEYMVKFLAPWIQKHANKYVPAVSALCEKFAIELPEEYLAYQQTKH